MNVELIKEIAVQIISSFLGSLCFALLFNLRGKRLLWASLGGAFAWAVFLVIEALTNNLFLCGVISAMVGTAYSEIFARILKTPKTAFIFPAIVPMVPGGSLYYTMSHIISGNTDEAWKFGAKTLSMAIALAFGIVVVILWVKVIKRYKKKKI